MDEQRAHRRQPVDFDANITVQGLRDHPCKVRDFCLGGALLSLEDPLRPLPPGFALIERGTPLEIRVITRSAGFRDAYTFSAVVARRDRQTLGIAFANPDPTSLMALQSLANVSNSQQRMGARTDLRKAKVDEAVVKRAISALRDRVQAEFSDLALKLVAESRKPLEELAEQAANSEERSRLVDAATVLRRYAADIQATFLRQALKPLEDFSGWTPGATLPGQGGSTKLSLIDKNAFEDWLAVKVMVSRAENDCKESLFELQLRFNEMFGAYMGVQNNPVGPAIFYHALGEPIQKLKLPKPVEQLLLRALENAMLDRLSKLYPALNQLLSGLGVMPDLEVGKHARPLPSGTPRVPSALPTSPARAPATTNVPSTPAAPAGTPPTVAPAASAGTATAAGPAHIPPTARPAVAATDNRAALSVRQFELQQKIARQAYSTVQNLLATRQAAAAPAPGSAAAAAVPVLRPSFEPQKVRSALDQLQKMPETAEAAGAPLRERLQKMLDPAGTGERALQPRQENAADTVDELFGQMLGTPLLREETRPLIRKLEVPFLKLMLEDPEFLTTEQHPARRVLNHVASLGARGAMTTPAQQQTIAETVSSLAARFERDIGVFTEALAVLERMIEQQRKVYEHNLARVRQSSEGQHRVLDARRKVLKALESVLGGRRVPRAVLSLLDAGWRESLVTEWLRHGSDSPQWKEAMGVVEQMVHGLDDPARFDMKALLATIKKGLSAQSAGQVNRDAVVGDLREMFTALSSGRVDAVPVVDVPVGAIDTETQTGAADDGELGRWLRRARGLEIGDWVELDDDDHEESQQARLAWVDAERNQFVFVNLQGMKIMDLDADSLARAFRDDRARRIDDPDTPMVDRGLEAMVRKVYGQLSHRATHDELTGLYNRKEFERLLQRKLSRIVAGEADWTLCWIDLDQFKVINGTCGFEAGNQLLIEIAKVIVSAAGSDSLVARLGGDEFAVLLRSEREETRRRAVDRILHAVSEYRFSWKDRNFPLAASAGMVMVNNAADTAETLMKSAEASCYAAKEAGRNRVHVFQEDDARLAERDDVIRWVSRLNEALEQDRLMLRCQRIQPVDPAAGLRPHYEILIAIEAENGEFIPPGSFMQAAERYNRMHAVDRWVIRNTLDWMHKNTDKLADIDGFSINLSGQSLNDEKLTSYILQQVMDSEVAREKVTFEVTETAAIANIADAADFIREMQAIGCKFSLDDFGSGLSSYSYLKHLPVDYVKIDGAFIRDLHRDNSDYMMVRSINEMAHLMGKRTIAEYVENDEILARLREIGIDYAQGYGIEKPRPLNSL
ncbi:MAG: DUF1631 family protein [Gammaproteobacteria bacterium]